MRLRRRKDLDRSDGALVLSWDGEGPGALPAAMSCPPAPAEPSAEPPPRDGAQAAADAVAFVPVRGLRRRSPGGDRSMCLSPDKSEVWREVDARAW